jgi:hypothetical protein
VKLLRQILTVLIVTAYVGTTMMQVVPASAAENPCMGMMNMTHDGDGKMPPCNDLASKCMSEMGCLFLLSLPAPNIHMATVLVWSQLTYNTIGHADLDGRLVEPALRPPNSLA